ncbi:MAG: TolC family protein [Prevotella sp.]|nr:TolC family protein [Prevotella sp.]
MKHKKMIMAMLLALLPLSVMAQRQWTLDECMDYAIGHNTDIMHLQNKQRRREIDAQASKDARLPRFSGDIDGYLGKIHHSSNGNRFDAKEVLLSMGVIGYMPLYTGNRLSSQIKASRYSVLAAAEDVLSAEKNIKVQVAAAYLQVLYNKGEVSIARGRQAVAQQLLQQARLLYEKGKRPESDVVEATAMVSRDEALLVAAESDVAMATLDLRLLMNLPDTVAFDVSQSTDTMNAVPALPPEALYTQTVARHPALQSARYGILQAEQGVTIARSGYYPTLSIAGALGTNWVNLDTKASSPDGTTFQTPLENLLKLNFDTDWKWKNFLFGYVGLRLSIPIFNAFETRARIRTAKVHLEDARLAHNDARQRINKDIRQAWQAALTASRRYEAEIRSEESSALAYRYAQKRYDAGMATLFDLNQIRQQWFTASENALRMKYEYLIRKRILDIQASE